MFCILVKEDSAVCNYKFVYLCVGLYVCVNAGTMCVCVMSINRDKELEDSKALACCMPDVMS